MSTGRKNLLIIGGVALAIAIIGGGAGAVVATGGDDDEQPITGSALEPASEAALDHTGGGTVTGTEVGDEESYYEVEVTREDGSQVDVQLDENFKVVGDERDGAGDEDD
jgi:uncharacterized membrane protein YkoI